MAKLSITLKIAGGNYPFPDIESSREELYRRAEKEVNSLFGEVEGKNLLPKDRLALAALQLAMENIELKNSRSLGEEIDRLAEVDRSMSEYFKENVL